MAVMSRLLPMVAFSTFAIFVLALLATPVNALANEPHAHVARGHDSIAKRKRNAIKRAKRCRPKPASPPSASPPAGGASYTPTADDDNDDNHSAPPATSPPPPSPPSPSPPSPSTQPATTPASNGGGSGGGGGLNLNNKLLLAWPNGPENLEKWKGAAA